MSVGVSEQTGVAPEEFVERNRHLLFKSVPASLRHENMCASRLSPADVFSHASIYVKRMVERQLHEFIESIERRRERDSARIGEYYTTLKQQIEAYIARRALTADAVKKQRQKLDALERDLAHKQRDVTEKYTVAMVIIPFAAIRIFVPVLVNQVFLLHGKERTSLKLVWNALTRQFDPLVCAQCKDAVYTMGACENWHVVCGACKESACTLCGKKQCLLCAPHCKRCGGKIS